MSDDRRMLRWILAALAPILAALALYLTTGEMPPGATDPDSTVVEPEPDPPSPDPRLVQGRFPALGFGWNALADCAPEGGGDWDVRIVPVSPSQNKAAAVAAIPEDGDLAVLVYTVGGEHRDAVPTTAWRDQTRRSCIVDAAHTAPAPYVIPSEHVRGGGMTDYVMRGMAYLGPWGSNSYYLECPSRSHVDLASFAFGGDDMVRFTGYTGQGGACDGGNTTLARVVVGPTGEGARGGGPNMNDCAATSWGIWLGMENVRRNPSVGCQGRINVSSVLCFNVTDCGRWGPATANIRGVTSIGGPVTGCALDRGVTYYDQANPVLAGSFYLEGVRVRAPVGCPWDEITALWDEDVTVFMRSEARVPVPSTLRAMAPHPDPEYPLPIDLTTDDILMQVGASWGLDCEGRWTRRPYALDEVSIGRVALGGGAGRWESRDHYESVHGTLELPLGTPCPDTNGNYIPDGVEARWGHSDPGRLMPDGRPAFFHWYSGFEEEITQ